MNYRQLQAFNAFMQYGSVSKAAQQLNISQPAVSRLLTALEQRAGFRLFDRKRNSLAATDEARVFHKTVIRSFISLQEIENQAKAIANKQVGSINIVSQPIYVSTYLLDVVADFKKRHPNVEITLHDAGLDGVLEKVGSRACDLGIGITLNMDEYGVQVSQLAKCRAACLLPINHPLQDQAVVKIEQLKNEKFVELSVGSPLRMRTDSLFQVVGVQRDITAQARTMRTVTDLVERGVGIAIVDPFVRLLLDPKKSVLKPLQPNIEWGVAIFSPSGYQLNELEQTFVKLLRRHIRILDKDANIS